MSTETAAIKFTQSENGRKMKNGIGEKVQTALLSIMTTGIVSCIGFLFKANAALSQIQQHDIDTDRAIDQLQQKVNIIQLDMRELRDKTIRIETLKTHK